MESRQELRSAIVGRRTLLFDRVLDTAPRSVVRGGVSIVGGQVDAPRDLPWTGWPSPRTPDPGGGRGPTRVLVPFNGTQVARKAIDVAASLTSGRTSVIWILYVRPWQIGRGGMRFCLETMDEARQCAQSAVTDLRCRGVSASAVVRDARRENVARMIADEGERLDVSCIVLGTHARGSLLSALLGSTSLSVARKATRPIILVKTPNRQRRWRRRDR
jgi:nucleotide-binding universal stress UspA family protein